MAWVIRTLILGLLTLMASCRKGSVAVSTVPSPRESTNQQVFEVKGIVQAVHMAQNEVVIKHEAITNYMPAMTMPFEVKNTNQLAGLLPGQPVSFRLVVTETEGWIEQIRSLGPSTNIASTAASLEAAGVHRVSEVQPLNVGDSLPQYQFTYQFGQLITTSQFKGQALAITFLFTRCPFPTFCPRMANQFAEAQQKLLSASQGPTNWQLLTISFDPEFDTPAVLKAYAQNHHYDPKHWNFATGDLGDITALGEQFGLAFWHDESGSITHNLRTIVIDANGRVHKVFEGGNWTSDELVTEVVQAAAKH